MENVQNVGIIIVLYHLCLVLELIILSFFFLSLNVAIAFTKYLLVY